MTSPSARFGPTTLLLVADAIERLLGLQRLQEQYYRTVGATLNGKVVNVQAG